MKFKTLSPLHVLLFSLILIFQFSCSKDSDLLTDYVLVDAKQDLVIGKFVVDDTFVTAIDDAIVLDVLANDTFEEESNVTVIETTTPANGDVAINTDNTITYTPTTSEEVIDTFTYTTEITNPDDQQTITEVATVTVTVTDDEAKNPVSGELKAFPSAYGGASNSIGGRGGVLIIVNTLDCSAGLSGPFTNEQGDTYYTGGIEAAMGFNAPRYIIFNVSGNINGSPCGDIATSRNYMTIFGQSAPQGGITLHNTMLRTSWIHDIVIRFLRVRSRLATGNPIPDDRSSAPFKFFGGGYNIMLDHCSASWGGDKGVNFFAGSDEKGVRQDSYTASRNIISDSNTSLYMGTSYGGSPELSDDLSVIYNLLGRGTNRLPSVNGSGYTEIQNNVIHQWSTKVSIVSGNQKMNNINNYYLQAPNDSFQHNLFQTLGGYDSPDIYTNGNFYSGVLTGSGVEDNSVIWGQFESPSGNPLPATHFSTTPHSGEIPNPAPLLTAAEAYTNVLADVGANAYLDDNGYPQTYIDSWDAGVINDALNNRVAEVLNSANWILPTIPSNTRPADYDTDNDGMADAWEIREFGDLTQGYNGDFDGDGYENIEEFMNQVDYN